MANPAKPADTDYLKDGDNEIRLTKRDSKTTFGAAHALDGKHNFPTATVASPPDGMIADIIGVGFQYASGGVWRILKGCRFFSNVATAVAGADWVQICSISVGQIPAGRKMLVLGNIASPMMPNARGINGDVLITPTNANFRHSWSYATFRRGSVMSMGYLERDMATGQNVTVTLHFLAPVGSGTFTGTLIVVLI